MPRVLSGDISRDVLAVILARLVLSSEWPTAPSARCTRTSTPTCSALCHALVSVPPGQADDGQVSCPFLVEHFVY
jgi:hypothetical protein